MNMPKDPYILLSYINAKLRNEFKTLDDLCQSYPLNQEQIITTLSTIGYIYNNKQNQFIANPRSD